MSDKIEQEQDTPMIMQIPAPIIVRRPRGFHATKINSRMDTRVKVLLDETEKSLIQDEAAQLGITMAEFVRHCAVQSAKYLHRYRMRHGQQQNEPQDERGDTV